jgi:putative membrane protein
MQLVRPYDGNVWKGLAAGIAGGLLASLVMNQFQALVKKATESQEKGKKKEKSQGVGGEDATVQAASAISEGLFHHRLAKDEKKVAGPVVHYAMGAAMGALYGVLAEVDTRLTSGIGVPFGAAVWLAADEIAVPALGLAPPPSKSPASTHASALASHAVYGLTTDLVRRALRRVM